MYLAREEDQHIILVGMYPRSDCMNAYWQLCMEENEYTGRSDMMVGIDTISIVPADQQQVYTLFVLLRDLISFLRFLAHTTVAILPYQARVHGLIPPDASMQCTYCCCNTVD
jgi:hypothetical protein